MIGCCLLDAQGSPWAKREAGQQGRSRTGIKPTTGGGVAAAAPGGAPLPERRECGPLPPAPAPACCREMTEPRDHTGRGTVTQGCRQALSRATLPWAGGGRERETPGQADAFCSRGPKEAASRLTLRASVPSSFLVTTRPRNSGQLDVHLPPNSSS